MTTTDTATGGPTVRAHWNDGGALRIELAGRLETRSLHDAWRRASRLVRRARRGKVTVDAAEVTYCDSTGATMLFDLRDQHKAHGGAFELVNFPDEFASVLTLIDRGKVEKHAPPATSGWFEFVGRESAAAFFDFLALVEAVGTIIVALLRSLRSPAKVRWQDALSAAQTVGVNSLPIVLLVSALLGLILGFQSAQTLRQYGADLLLADLIGISFLRELGPLMTAIILTARSGSAFAAEIGTMQISEEVDALRTMGVDPVRFLVVPRMLAAIVMTPLLTIFANLAGLAGGLIVWTLTLDFSFPGYLAQLELAVTSTDFYTGLVKATVFGVLVAGIGCIRGMQTAGSASAVGQSTTSSVVSGIVLIAITDAMFTILFHYLDL